MPFIRRTPAAGASASTPAQDGSTPSPTPTAELRGLRPSPTGQKLLSSGVGSLDDILGGGMPLSTSLLLLAPDAHTQWSRLVARHIASAGLIDGQNVVIIGDRSWADGLPWLDPRSDGSESEGEAEGNSGRQREEKIAWRYDKMGRFRTTVGSSRIAANTTIPPSTRAELEQEGRLTYIDPGTSLTTLLFALTSIPTTSQVTRIILPDLGGLNLPLTATESNRVLYTLRYVLRSLPAIGVVTVPSRVDTPTHLADAVISLSGFGGSPALARAYYPSHGLLTPHKLYSGHNLLAPALRYSQLLGVASGAGEQNLGFRLKRKRWVVESVHLGIEGGSNERRTEPAKAKRAEVEVAGPSEGVEPAMPSVSGLVDGSAGDVKESEGGVSKKQKEKKHRARVRFGDVEEHTTAQAHSVPQGHVEPVDTHAHVHFAEAEGADPPPSAKDHTAAHTHLHSQGVHAHVHFEDKEMDRSTAQDHSMGHTHSDEGGVRSSEEGGVHVHFGDVVEPVPSARDHTLGHGSGHGHGEGHGHGHGHDHGHGHGHGQGGQAPRVEIRHDRPDLYEF